MYAQGGRDDVRAFLRGVKAQLLLAPPGAAAATVAPPLFALAAALAVAAERLRQLSANRAHVKLAAVVLEELRLRLARVVTGDAFAGDAAVRRMALDVVFSCKMQEDEARARRAERLAQQRGGGAAGGGDHLSASSGSPLGTPTASMRRGAGAELQPHPQPQHALQLARPLLSGAVGRAAAALTFGQRVSQQMSRSGLSGPDASSWGALWDGLLGSMLGHQAAPLLASALSDLYAAGALGPGGGRAGVGVGAGSPGLARHASSKSAAAGAPAAATPAAAARGAAEAAAAASPLSAGSPAPVATPSPGRGAPLGAEKQQATSRAGSAAAAASDTAAVAAAAGGGDAALARSSSGSHASSGAAAAAAASAARATAAIVAAEREAAAEAEAATAAQGQADEAARAAGDRDQRDGEQQREGGNDGGDDEGDNEQPSSPLKAKLGGAAAALKGRVAAATANARERMSRLAREPSGSGGVNCGSGDQRLAPSASDDGGGAGGGAVGGSSEAPALRDARVSV